MGELKKDEKGRIICPVCKSGKGILFPYEGTNIPIENPHQHIMWCEWGKHLLIIQEWFKTLDVGLVNT